jgi:hypothetical protein
MEPTSGPGQPYYIYQAYFVAPVLDFRNFTEMRDTTNDRPIDFWSMSQMDLANEDPQRTDYSDPLYCVQVGYDYRVPGSQTYGWQMFELWPQQLSRVPYSFSYKRRGPQLVNNYDTLLFPLTEDLVKSRAKNVLCLYKEMQKEKDVARGSGANWLMLADRWMKEYEEKLYKIIAVGANLTNEFVTKVDRASRNGQQGYSNRDGSLNVGDYPGYR